MNDAAAPPLETVRSFDHCEGVVVCAEFDGLVNADDHERVLGDAIRRAVATHGRYRLLAIYKPGFQGWEPAAADANMRLILECGQKCERVAFIDPPAKKILQMKLSPTLVKGEIRYFNADQMRQAIDWINA